LETGPQNIHWYKHPIVWRSAHVMGGTVVLACSPTDPEPQKRLTVFYESADNRCNERPLAIDLVRDGRACLPAGELCNFAAKAT
jgi:hypothetical protein